MGCVEHTLVDPKSAISQRNMLNVGVLDEHGGRETLLECVDRNELLEKRHCRERLSKLLCEAKAPRSIWLYTRRSTLNQRSVSATDVGARLTAIVS